MRRETISAAAVKTATHQSSGERSELRNVDSSVRQGGGIGNGEGNVLEDYLFGVRHNVNDAVNIALDEEVEAPTAVDAGMPEILR